MRLLVTRPSEDAVSLLAALRARGHQPIVAPVMEIVPRPDAEIDLTGVQALLATSRNGIRAVAERIVSRDLPVFAVGQSTAEAARMAGFSKIERAGGDVTALAALVTSRLDPSAGALLHVAGSVQAGDLAGALEPHGFQVRRAVLYEARALNGLPDAALEALARHAADGALFYSPRTARLFGAMADAAGQAGALAALTAFCLSPAVAEAARSAGFRLCRVAAAPDEAALLALIDP